MIRLPRRFIRAHRTYQISAWVVLRTTASIALHVTAGKQDARQNRFDLSAGTRKFSYGDAPEQGRCVDRESSPLGPRSAGSTPGCEGAYPGLFDMCGNVWEWLDDCSPGLSEPDAPCDTFGASFEWSYRNTGCAEGRPTLRNDTSEELGFRCCADP